MYYRKGLGLGSFYIYENRLGWLNWKEVLKVMLDQFIYGFDYELQWVKNKDVEIVDEEK